MNTENTVDKMVSKLFEAIATRGDQFFKAKNIQGGVRCGDDLFSPIDKLELKKSLVAYGNDIRSACTLESKHMYQVGFDHGQQNVKDALRDLITPLLDSVNGDCCRGEEWEMEQVSIIRRIIK